MVLQLVAKHFGCGQGLKDIKYDLESDCQKRSIQGKTRLLYPSLINVASNRALDISLNPGILFAAVISSEIFSSP